MTARPTEKQAKSALPNPVRRAVALPPRREPRFSAPTVARGVPVKAVGSFVPALTRKAFEKFGFSTATLMLDWAQVVGADVARYTQPERLKWPRGGEAAAEDDAERRGATLVLRVDPARALDVEYKSRQLMERINAHYGYRAVESIRIVQAPLPPPPSWGRIEEGGNPNGQRSAIPPPLTPSHEGEGKSAPADDPLAAALARLERGIRRDQAARRG